MGIFDRLGKIFRSEENENKKNKETKPDRLEANMANLRIGDLVEYDLSTWDVIGVNKYRYGNEDSLEFVLKEGSKIIYLEKGESGEWKVGIAMPISKLDPNLKILLDERGKPPEKFHYDKTYYHLDEEGSGSVNFHESDCISNFVTFDYWDFIDEEDEKSISISAWPNAGYEATVASYEPERKFKVLPGSN